MTRRLSPRRAAPDEPPASAPASAPRPRRHARIARTKTPPSPSAAPSGTAGATGPTTRATSLSPRSGQPMSPSSRSSGRSATQAAPAAGSRPSSTGDCSSRAPPAASIPSMRRAACIYWTYDAAAGVHTEHLHRGAGRPAPRRAPQKNENGQAQDDQRASRRHQGALRRLVRRRQGRGLRTRCAERGVAVEDAGRAASSRAHRRVDAASRLACTWPWARASPSRPAIRATAAARFAAASRRSTSPTAMSNGRAIWCARSRRP